MTNNISTDLATELVELLKENRHEQNELDIQKNYIIDSLNRLNPFKVGKKYPVMSLSYNVKIESAWTVVNDNFEYTFFAKGTYGDGFVVTLYTENGKIVVE